mmetsp:Transcript_124/g.475  ORF Transcript_124/g.475 Transcript_124/m.475 type:complete len:421 (+) Transcript_124:1520-2782(+)
MGGLQGDLPGPCQPHGLRQVAHQGVRPVRLVEHRPEVLLEHRSLEKGPEVGEPLLHVELVEEVGVLKPRGQDGLVPAPYSSLVDLPVRNGHERREELARLCVLHREVPLVLLHHHHQNLLGQLEEVLGKRSHDGRRVLNQVGYLGQELLPHSFGNDAARRRRQRLGLGPDRPPPLLHVHHQAAALHLAEVAGGRGDLDFRNVEAVPEAQRGPAAPHPAGDEGHDGISVQGDDPPQRAGVGRPRAPAHALPKLELAHQIGEAGGQQVPSCLPPHALRHPAVLHALLVRLELDVLHTHAVLLAVPEDRLGGVPLPVKRDFRWRAPYLLHPVLLPGRQAPDHGEYPPRRAGRHDLAVLEAELCQELPQPGRNLARRAGHLVRRELLRAKLKEEVLGGSQGLGAASLRRGVPEVPEPTLAKGKP